MCNVLVVHLVSKLHRPEAYWKVTGAQIDKIFHECYVKRRFTTCTKLPRAHSLTFCFFKLHFNIIFPNLCTCYLIKVVLSLRGLPLKLYSLCTTAHLYHACYTPPPPLHPYRHYHPTLDETYLQIRTHLSLQFGEDYQLSTSTDVHLSSSDEERIWKLRVTHKWGPHISSLFGPLFV
jgi:hypothetical protein